MSVREINISYVVKEGLCHQCGTCYSICPQNCITIKRDEMHNYVPVIDEQLCSKCKLCLKVCPGIEVNFDSLISSDLREQSKYHPKIGQYQKSFLGYSTDEKIRDRASSGGIVPAIMVYLLEAGAIDGAVVVKSIEKDPFTPQIFIAKTPQEIFDSMQSKYHPVCLNTILRDIDNTDGKYALAGLPCHIQGLRKYERFKVLEKKIFITLGLFCGLNLRFDSLEFLVYKVEEDLGSLQNVYYREGKWPGKTVLKFSKTNKYIVDKNMINHIFTLPRCLYCIDHTSELADISCGDAWLREVLEKGDSGWSAIISRSSKGQEILDKLQREDEVFLENVDINKIVESQYPMLCFKKENSWLRMKMSKIIGQKVPQYDIQSLNKSISIFYLIGNITLILVIYLMKIDRFKNLVMNLPMSVLNLYKILILKLLYRDKFLHRIGRKIINITKIKV